MIKFHLRSEHYCEKCKELSWFNDSYITREEIGAVEELKIITNLAKIINDFVREDKVCAVCRGVKYE